MIKALTRSGKLDLLGSIVSLACAIHCFAFPLLISWGSFITLSTYEHDVIEPLLLSVGLLLCIWSVSFSYRTHKKISPFILFAMGLVIIGFGRLPINELYEVIINTLGALFLTAAHIQNRKLLKLSKA